MIADALERAWAEEKAMPATDPYAGRRIVEIRSPSVFAGLETDGRRRFVAFRLTSEERNSARERLPRSSAGILVETVSEPGGTTDLFLREQPGVPDSVFSVVLADVLQLLIRPSPTGPALRGAFERFSSWQKALARTRGPATSAQVRGMLGELLFLRDTLAPALGLPHALTTWKAPDESSVHDFATDAWELEVKTGLAPVYSVHVNCDGQLESRASLAIVLAVIDLEASTDGVSLAETVDSLLRTIGPEAPLRSQIEEALVLRGVRLAAASPEGMIRYRAERPAAYRVAAGFPLIAAASVPPGVEDVRYLLNLAACTKFRISQDELSALIRTAEVSS